MFDVQKSIENRHWLQIGFFAETPIDVIRLFVEKSGGHLFHMYENEKSAFIYIAFPMEISLENAFRKILLLCPEEL